MQIKLEQEAFIDEVFLTCCKIFDSSDSFTEKTIYQKMIPAECKDEDLYWAKKNISNSLKILDKAKLIKSHIKPRFTENSRFTIEETHGEIATIGKTVRNIPKILRLFYLSGYIHKQKLLSALGAFALIYLCSKAFKGLEIVFSLWEYIIVAIVFYILFLAINKVVD